ncbi:MAG: aspartate aminotransferase family protein [Gammaproteobacteria bacterium]|nr:aspartate aminotransferase family protein [Gammaproteobacteria bacterium]
MHTYSPLPVTFTHGKGAWLWDTNGNKYLDAISGIAVTGLGHAHPDVSKAICEQANQLLHTSNLFHIAQQRLLADKLITLTAMDNVFFSNSGAEANETAIKLARLYGHKKGIRQPSIVVTENSFHGRTLATLSATGNRKVQAGFEPLVLGFSRAPYNDIDALHSIAQHDKNVVAILLEPVQGETGIAIPDNDYLTRVRDLCNEFGWLMMLDEIQTGVGRSGQWFAFQHSNIKPDVMTLAKALGNGIPIGACIARGEAANTFKPGNHGSTFGGNPLACRASLAVLDIIEKQDLVKRAALLGDKILNAFRLRLASHQHVKEIRGKGLLIAIELNQPCKTLAQQALDIGVIINIANENNIRLLPPLIISDSEADLMVDKVSQLVENFHPDT